MVEEENIKLLKLSRIINDFVLLNKETGWYAPDLAKAIISKTEATELAVFKHNPIKTEKKVMKLAEFLQPLLDCQFCKYSETDYICSHTREKPCLGSIGYARQIIDIVEG